MDYHRKLSGFHGSDCLDFDPLGLLRHIALQMDTTMLEEHAISIFRISVRRHFSSPLSSGRE
jgi:hypothetical protein